MVDKLHEYQGPVGIAHTWRDALQERWYGWKENRPRTLLQLLQSLGLAEVPGSPVEDEQTPAGVDMDQYSHIFRKKTRRELIRISAAVMGIEFSYAAETAFVSPTLLKIGVDHQHMTLVWAVSPCIGFFVTPILGSLSDRCTLPLGRRRPFLILLACGVFLGMMLVPNGESLGHWVEGASGPGVSNFWPIFFTVLGTVLLDFDADACQSPARAYLLDICVPEDHAKGLSTFTVMAGLGGFVGYLLGAVDWDSLKFGELMGGHVRAVFTLVTFLFVGCISYTVSSFKEMPLKLQRYNQTRIMVTDVDQGGDGDKLTDYAPKSYGTLVDTLEENNEPVLIPEHATFTHYLKTIVVMPTSIKLVCLTNLFCWMAHVCYSLYFTDYVGEAVFGGDPTAPPGSQGKLLYEQGVRFGSMGMSMYSLSCACYSSVIEKFIKRFGAKRVYTGGLLFYSAGMFMMAVTRHKFSVIFFSWAAGVMYSTMFTMPFLLIAHYHSTNKFSESLGDNERVDDQIRGLGTDVAVVSSSVFVAQFILSMCMGTIVNFFGTTSAVVYTASFLGFCASLIASQIVYMDLTDVSLFGKMLMSTRSRIILAVYAVILQRRYSHGTTDAFFPEAMVLEGLGLTDVAAANGSVSNNDLQDHNETSTETDTGDLNDALMTMTFHREKMQDYLCRQYVAEEILQGIAGNAESESRSISTGYGSSKSSVMRMDQGSSAYNRWLNKAQIMKKIYDDYDLNIRMHEQPEGFKFKLKNYNEGLQNVGSANRTTNTDDSRKDFYPYEDNILSPSNSVDFVQSHSISFDDTGNGTNTAERMQPSPNVPPVYYGPPQVPPMSYEPSPNMPYGYPAVMPNNYNGYYGPPNLQPPAATVLPSLTSPTPVGTTSNVETLSDDSEQSNEDDNGGIRRGLTATDLYDLVLTAIAFLGFGTFVMNLVMDAMTTQSGATLMMSSAPLLGASVSRDGRQLNPPVLEIDELAWTVAKGLDNLIASVDGKAVDCGLAKKLCVKSKKLIKTGTNFSTTLLPAWNVALGWLSNRLGRDTRQPVIMAFLEQCSLPLQCQRNAFK